MDWVIMVITLLANMLLGWSRGRIFAWIFHASVNGVWIIYSIKIHQNGLLAMAVITILLDIFTIIKIYISNRTLRLSLER